MTLALVVAFQTVTAAASPPLSTAFDLKTFQPADNRGGRGRCAPQTETEIVVCGRRDGGGRRIVQMEPLYAEKPFRAEVSIGNGATLRAYGDSVAMPNGQISKRAMLGVKVPF